MSINKLKIEEACNIQLTYKYRLHINNCHNYASEVTKPLCYTSIFSPLFLWVIVLCTYTLRVMEYLEYYPRQTLLIFYITLLIYNRDLLIN